MQPNSKTNKAERQKLAALLEYVEQIDAIVANLETGKH
jgi:hypothetical protein